MRERQGLTIKLSVLFTDEEYARLQELAGVIPLSTFVRALLCGLRQHPEVASEAWPTTATAHSDPPTCTMRKLDVMLSEEEFDYLKSLAGDKPPGPCLRKLLNEVTAEPDFAYRLLHGTSTKSIQEG